MFKHILPTILLCCFALAEAGKSYRGYKALRLSPTTLAQAQWIRELQDRYSLDFWSDNIVMVNPEQATSVIEELNSHGISWEVLVPDVQELIQPSTVTYSSSIDTVDPFSKYNRYDEILKLLSEMEARHPNLVSLSSIGNSSEGRSLPIIKISTDKGNQERPIILIDAGIHAREWITIAMALYIIQQLVEEPSNQDLLHRADWHIIPVLNPDGYEYSHIEDRMWRKTRSHQTCLKSSDPKAGVDVNRNFDYHWMENVTSPSPCSVSYPGPKPFSEPETRGLRDYVLGNADRIKLYISFHAFGEIFYYPWGFPSDPLDNEEEIVLHLVAAVQTGLRVSLEYPWPTALNFPPK